MKIFFIKDILNFYSTEAIKIEIPMEYDEAVRFLHEELNKINLTEN